ncbi:MAG: hypothetical protein WBR15_00360 [Gammaproteobacteria bacterium]
MFLKKTVILVFMLISTLTAGCGGSSTSTTPPILEVVPGPWSGTYSLNGGSQISASGVVSSGGFGYFADNQGNVFMLEEVPETTPFTSTIIGTAPRGETFPDGNNVDTFSVNGNYSSSATATSMQATLTSIDPTTGVTTGLNGNFSMTSNVPYTGTPSLAALQGQWTGYYVGKASTSVAITISADGVFNGNDGYGCNISGSLVQQDPGTNLYYVNYITKGSGCPGIMDGLAFESSKDTSGSFGGAAGTYLYLGIFGLDVAYSAELKL